VVRPTLWSLFEPHHEQNLYANPKRTAKPNPFTISDVATWCLVQTKSNFFLPAEIIVFQAILKIAAVNRLVAGLQIHPVQKHLKSHYSTD
jgi:hypothetical protein